MPARVTHIGRWCRRAVAGGALLAVMIALRGSGSDRTARPAPLAIVAVKPASAAVREPKLFGAPAPVRVITAHVTVAAGDGASGGAAGVAVAGAQVVLHDGHGDAPLAVTTDRDGVARFSELASGPYELIATTAGTATTPGSVAIARAEEAGGTIELALEPAARVSGRVVIEGDGELAPGASVALVPYELDAPVQTAALDPHGAFAFATVPFGRWRIEATVPGFAQTDEAVVTASDRESTATIRMQHAGSLTGTVVDATGAPVAHATLVLVDQPAPATLSRTSGSPAGQGDVASRAWPFTLDPARVRWIHPLAGAHWLPANDSGRFGAPRPGQRPAECGRGHCGLDLGHVRGSIVHAVDDGEIASLFPVPNTEAGKVVVVQHANGLKTYYMHLDEIRPGLEIGQPIRAGEPVGTLGSTGFTRAVPHLHFAVTYEHQGRTWYLDPEPLMRAATVLPAARAYEPVAGTPAVAASVQPLAAVAHDPGSPVITRVTTDANGVFRLDAIAPGSYVAGAFTPDSPPATSAPFVVHAGEETTGIVIRIAAGMIVQGRVVGRDGPIANATVVAGSGFGESAHKIAKTSTDRYGEFTLRSLAGKITLAVDAPGYGEVERPVVLEEPSTTPSARPHREDFKLVVEDAILRGVVLAPDGGAAPGVAIRVVDGPTRRTGITDPQGRFAIAPVATGHYIVELASADYPVRRATLDSDRWLELRMEAGGGARAALTDATTGTPLVARIEGTGPAGQTIARTTDVHGIAELRGLAAGDWTFVARAPGFTSQPRTLTIRAGRMLQDLSLTAVHGATLAGVVRDRQGQRVAGARVHVGTATAVADRDGNFRISNAPVGAVTVEAESDGHHGALPLTLVPSDERLTVTVELTD